MTVDVRQQGVEAEAKTPLLGFATLDFVEACDGTEDAARGGTARQ